MEQDRPSRRIAIGLSKARRAGVKLPPPGSSTSKQTRRKARQDSKAAAKSRKPSPKRSRAVTKALKREQRSSASPRALSATGASSSGEPGPEKSLGGGEKGGSDSQTQ